jgi:hypothetical protein
MQGIYVDGLRTPLLLHSPNETYAADYDAEFTVLLSDWYHQEQPVLLKSFLSIANPGGAEPIPGELPRPIVHGNILMDGCFGPCSIGLQTLPSYISPKMVPTLHLSQGVTHPR